LFFLEFLKIDWSSDISIYKIKESYESQNDKNKKRKKNLWSIKISKFQELHKIESSVEFLTNLVNFYEPLQGRRFCELHLKKVNLGLSALEFKLPAEQVWVARSSKVCPKSRCSKQKLVVPSYCSWVFSCFSETK
jgi:hypothetical protein